MQILGYDIRIYFLLLMIYSVLGWILEVLGKMIIEHKKFINRGFLIGPYCPIYGYGALLITFCLNNYKNDPIILFIMAIVICGTLEYITSYIMEKLFKARWWDYSQRKFNINGRVCLYTIVPFGILGLLIMYVSNPFIISKLELIPDNILTILFWVFLAIYISDNIISYTIIRYVRKTEDDFGKELDNTEEITEKVKDLLQEKSPLHRRLLDAYPNFEAVKIKIKEQSKKIKKEVIEQKEEIEEKARKVKNKVTKKIKFKNAKEK